MTVVHSASERPAAKAGARSCVAIASRCGVERHHPATRRVPRSPDRCAGRGHGKRGRGSRSRETAQAARALARRPAFTAMTVGTLALGIGGVASIRIRRLARSSEAVGVRVRGRDRPALVERCDPASRADGVLLGFIRHDRALRGRQPDRARAYVGEFARGCDVGRGRGDREGIDRCGGAELLQLPQRRPRARASRRTGGRKLVGDRAESRGVGSPLGCRPCDHRPHSATPERPVGHRRSAAGLRVDWTYEQH